MSKALKGLNKQIITSCEPVTTRLTSWSSWLFTILPKTRKFRKEWEGLVGLPKRKISWETGFLERQSKIPKRNVLRQFCLPFAFIYQLQALRQFWASGQWQMIHANLEPYSNLKNELQKCPCKYTNNKRIPSVSVRFLKCSFSIIVW